MVRKANGYIPSGCIIHKWRMLVEQDYKAIIAVPKLKRNFDKDDDQEIEWDSQPNCLHNLYFITPYESCVHLCYSLSRLKKMTKQYSLQKDMLLTNKKI